MTTPHRLTLFPALALLLSLGLAGCFEDPQDGGSEGTAGVDALADIGDTSEPPCKGDPGCPCVDDIECKTGYCKDGVCAEPCGGPCPEGETCKNVGRGGKKIYECIKDIEIPDCVTETGGEVCDGKDNDCDGVTDNAACDDDNPCTLDECDPSRLDEGEESGCTHTNLTTACSDGDPCTAGDVCEGGACKSGGAKDCDDGKVCTKDSCSAAEGGCVNQVLTGSCDDGDACTEGDTCTAEGDCKGTGPDCDDNNVCTTDYCKPGEGCQNDPNSEACDDGDPCTTGDQCAKGQCETGITTVCDDGNPCTEDACDPKKVTSKDDGCTYTKKANICEDGDACTIGDKCVDGACKAGAPKDCDDGNSCTADTCDKETGECKFAQSKAGEVCDDGNPCTEGDACLANGGCIGKLKDCDDSKLCTIDKCDTNLGKCFYENNTGQACEDGNACTLGDTCVAGGCKSGAGKLCNDSQPCTNDSCDAKTGSCVFTPNKASCDDGNPCTTKDGCDGGSCKGLENKNCDDGNACTLNKCDSASGKCETKNAADNVVCNDANLCTQGDACKKGACTAGPALYCDDGNPCTNDTCDAKTGKCINTPNAAACDDGNDCTTGDVCSAGKCSSGKNTCECEKDADCAGKEDGNACNGTLFCDLTSNSCKVDSNTIVICDPSKNTACTTFACSPKSGKCEGVAKPNGSACEADDSVCTQGDECNEGVCKPGKSQVCTDSNPCTTDACDPKKGCTFTFNTAPCFDGDLCTKNDACKNGSCQKGTVVKTCSDNDVCTNDVCNSKTGNCAFLPLTGPACNDGNACTSGDACVEGGCKPGNAKVCDDGNPCTLDVCNSKTGTCGSKPSFDGLGCDDGQKCTKGDFCKAGSCQSGEVPNCDDGSPCTKGVCVPTTGDCKQIATGNGKPCNDGNACTVNDVCKNGYCLPADNKLCDDDNECTTDACDKQSGICKYEPLAKGAQCSDGDLCTLDDGCDGAGACVATKKAICDDKNPCTIDTCDKKTGKCLYKAAPPKPLIKCDDGNACTYDKAIYYKYKDFTDKCYQGKCVGQKRSCNDGNQCTVDSCDPKSGCKHKFLGPVSCNDGNKCTVGDSCKSGSCKGTGKTCNDGNACTNNVCDPKKGCTYPNNNQSCNDGSVCTTGDKCTGGKCTGQNKLDCDDGKPCTDDPCNAKTGCYHVNDDKNPCSDGEPCTMNDNCKNGKCVGGGPTDCDDKEICSLDSCEQGKGCVHKNAGGKTCDDGNKCTKVDVCAGGKCTSSGSLDCNDGNVCTIDACDPKKGCVSTPHTGPCDDDNACTENDKCSNLACVAGPKAACKDDSDCTVDGCDPKIGCTYTPATGQSTATLSVRSDFQTQTWTWFKQESGQQAPADQQSAVVTVGGSAGWTAKIPGAAWIWRDAAVKDPTKDQTVWFERGFSVPPSAKGLKGTLKVAGDDDYSCTLNGKAVVSHSAKSGNGAAAAKTVDVSGVVVVGGNTLRCKVTNIGKAGSTAQTNPAGLLFGLDLSFGIDQLGCDDGNACTGLDVCDKGKCVGLNGVQCNDDNPCTLDTCDPAKGCVQQANNGADCSDGDACTADDICNGGKCQTTKKTNCDDGSACTVDTCDTFKGCLHAPEKPGVAKSLSGKSDSGTLATTTFKTVGGKLVPTNLKPAEPTYDKFPEWTSISGATWIWSDKIVTEPTKDQTVFFVKTFEVPAGAEELGGTLELAADEAYTCRLNGLLIGKSVEAKPWVKTAKLPLGTAVKVGANTLLCEVFNKGKAGSNLLNNPAGLVYSYVVTWQDKGQSKPCNDGNACTKSDGCNAKGLCVSGPPVSCDDDNACTIDSCDNAKGCLHVVNDKAACNDGSVCTSGDACKEGKCVGSGQLKCDDDNPCTVNSCDKAQGCVFPPVSGAPKCSDGGPCLTDTVCSGGKCLGKQKDCGDGNACTNDSCDDKLGCVNQPDDNNTCDDGDTCTANDHCKNGQCLGKKTAPCDDGNACTKDACDVGKGCTHTPSTGTVCEDGNACTLQDVCNAGVCQAGAKKDCFDTEQCTVDSCDAKTGKCTFSPLSDGACDDGNLCTLNDACVAGKCIAGKAPPCGDGDPCTVDNCDPGSGKCIHDAAKESSSCDDGNLCTSSSKCVQGKCLGAAKDCDDKSECTIDSCAPSSGKCGHVPVSDGTTCGKAGKCKKGVCLEP